MKVKLDLETYTIYYPFMSKIFNFAACMGEAVAVYGVTGVSTFAGVAAYLPATFPVLPIFASLGAMLVVGTYRLASSSEAGNVPLFKGPP